MPANMRSLPFVVVLAVVVLTSPAFLCAQEFRAFVEGQIVDPSGAPIPGAAVTAVKLDTKQTYTAKSEAGGAYALQFLLPGQYALTVEAQGFTKKVYTNVTLESAQKLNLNVTLDVGSSHQEVTVTASVGLLNTATATSGGVLDQTKVENMPSEGHQSWQDLVFTQGVKLLSNEPFNTTVRNNTNDVYSVNGAPTTSNAFYINGAPVSDMDVWYISPIQDAISELQAANNAYDAQYGRAGGGSFNINVKSGSNSFHGELHEYGQNSALGTNTWAANLFGDKKALNNEHHYGGTLGGPIRKDKTFFFGGYAAFRQSFPSPVSDSVPPVSWRPLPDGSVNLSQFGFTVYDPLTTFCAATNAQGGCTTYNRMPFPNDIIPANRISSFGKAIVGLYPEPSISGPNSNYSKVIHTLFAVPQYIGRVDHNFSENTRLYGLFLLQQNYAKSPGNSFNNGAVTSRILTGTPVTAIFDITRVLSPSLVADVKLSFVRYTSFTLRGTAVQQNLSANTLGLTMPNVPSTTHQNIVPVIDSSLTQLFGNTNNGTVNNDRDFSASLSQAKGRHNLHYGGDLFAVQSGAGGIPGQPNGEFSFSGQWTKLNPLAGGTNLAQSYADMLLGYPTGGALDWSQNPFVTYHSYGLYVQDDFKFRRNLTFNVGLRWDAYTSVTERYNRINAGFCLSCTNPYDAQINHTTYPNLPNPLTGGWRFAGAGGAPRNPFGVQLNDFQPRFGISWAITPKWVFRAGYGIFSAHGFVATDSVGNNQTTSYISSLDGGLTPTNFFLSGNPYPNGIIAPLGSSQGLETAAGQSIAFNNTDRRVPLTQQWTVGFQRELPKQILLDIEYAGSETHPYGVATQLDSLSIAGQAQCFQNMASCNANVPNPFFGVLPVTTALGASRTIPAWKLTLPWPLFNGITEITNPRGSSHYNALQVRVDRKIQTLDFVVNYVYSNWMDKNSYLNGGLPGESLWSGPDPNDRRHYLDFNAVWPLPIGHGQFLAGSASGWRGGLLNNWLLDSFTVWNSGVPERIPAANFYGPGCTSYVPAGGQTPAHMFNNDVNCYHDLQPFQLRTAPLRVGYLRNVGAFSSFLTLQKKFALPREGMFLQVITEGVNWLNHPIFADNAANINNHATPTNQPQIGWTGFGTLPLTNDQGNDPRYIVIALRLLF